MKAEDIGSFDVTPSWDRPTLPVREPADPLRNGTYCRCGFCQAATAGHL